MNVKKHPDFTDERRLAMANALLALSGVEGERNTAIYIDSIAVHMHPTGRVRVMSLRPRYEIAFYSSIADMASPSQEQPK